MQQNFINLEKNEKPNLHTGSILERVLESNKNNTSPQTP